MTEERVLDWDSNGDAMYCTYRGLFLFFEDTNFSIEDPEGTHFRIERPEDSKIILSGDVPKKTDNEMVEFLAKVADDLLARGLTK